jgi:hypothetical protein
VSKWRGGGAGVQVGHDAVRRPSLHCTHVFRAAEADELAKALQAIDRRSLTQGGRIFVSAALAFFSHARQLELPYGPLLGYAWAKGMPFVVPAGHEFPCPQVDASEWATLFQAQWHHGRIVCGRGGGGSSGSGPTGWAGVGGGSIQQALCCKGGAAGRTSASRA